MALEAVERAQLQLYRLSAPPRAMALVCSTYFEVAVKSEAWALDMGRYVVGSLTQVRGLPVTVNDSHVWFGPAETQFYVRLLR
jgi:hypothetical protein